MDCGEILFDQRLVLYSAPVVSLTYTFCNSVQHTCNFSNIGFSEMMVRELYLMWKLKKFIKDLPAGQAGIKHPSLSLGRGRWGVKSCNE